MHIDEMLELFRRRYNRRNRLCFPYGLQELLQLMGQAFAELNHLIRSRSKDPPEIIEVGLVDAVAWLCAVINCFDDLPFAQALITKYGKMECFHCSERSCTCDPNDRPKTEAIKVFEEMVPGNHGNTIRWWCHHLKHIFEQRDREEGTHGVVARLIEKTSEVSSLAGHIVFKPNGDLDNLERQFALDLSDIFVCLITIANLKDIDLTTAILNRYGEGCPTCKAESCQCPRLTIVKG